MIINITQVLEHLHMLGWSTGAETTILYPGHGAAAIAIVESANAPRDPVVDVVGVSHPYVTRVRRGTITLGKLASFALFWPPDEQIEKVLSLRIEMEAVRLAAPGMRHRKAMIADTHNKLRLQSGAFSRWINGPSEVLTLA